MNHRRINLYASSGAGKSTLAAYIFAHLKMANYDIEHVQEYIKSWTYQNRTPDPFDQIYLLGKQMYYEHRFLSKGVDLIVTDSPVMLSCHYTEYNFSDLFLHHPMFEIAHKYENDYPSLNLFINRGNKPYKQKGRYQDKAEAIKIDKFIYESLKREKIPFKEFDFQEKDEIVEYIKKNL